MATATEQIRTEEPVKNTFHNLVQTLNVKLDSAARYGLYQEDARKDGFDDCAELFGKLQESEREEIQGLVRCLQKHIGESGAGE
jgi:rubrerythrin